MTGDLRVHHASLEQSADDMDRTFAKIQDTLSDLEKLLDPLKADWSGEQQGAYQQAKAVWDTEMSQMATVLTETSNTVRTANGDYMLADKKGAGLFNG